MIRFGCWSRIINIEFFLELNVVFEQGLLNAVMELMEEEEILDVDINEFLKEDLALAQRDLGAVATLKGSQV